MESKNFGVAVEELFKKDSKLVYILCPSLEPPQFLTYLKKILTLKIDGLKDVLALLGLPKYGNKGEMTKRLFNFFYSGPYPENEIPLGPAEENNKFIEIIQSIVEQNSAIPKSFLSYFNRKEELDTLKRRITEEQTVSSLKKFLIKVGRKPGYKSKDEYVAMVMEYFRPKLSTSNETNENTSKKKIPEEKPSMPAQSKETLKRSKSDDGPITKKELTESKKRKISGEEELKQPKKIKTEKPQTSTGKELKIESSPNEIETVKLKQIEDEKNSLMKSNQNEIEKFTLQLTLKENEIIQLQNESQLKNYLMKSNQNEIEKLENEIIQLQNEINELRTNDLITQSINGESENQESFETGDFIPYSITSMLQTSSDIEGTKITIRNIYKSFLKEVFDTATTDAENNADKHAAKISSYSKSMTYIESLVNLPECKDYDDKYLALFLYTAEIETGYSIYNLLNQDLTSPSCKRNESLRKWKSYLIHLRDGLKEIPRWKPENENSYLWRGVPKDLVAEFPKKYQEKSKFTWYPFSSTSTSPHIAKKFTKGVSTIFKITKAFSGRDISKYSHSPNEKEVLFPPFSVFLVHKIEKTTTGVTITISQEPGTNEFGLED